MKKKTKLFRHFTTLLHICALSIPLFTLIGTFIFNYVAPIAYFASHKANAEYRSETIMTNNLQSLQTYYISKDYPVYSGTNSNGYVNRKFYVDSLYIGDTLNGSVASFQLICNFSSHTFELLGYDSNNNRILDSYINQIDTVKFTFIQFQNFDNGTLDYSLFNPIFYYINYVDINDVGGLDDVENYPLKSFDDACFYTLVNVGALHANQDYSNLSDYLYSIDGVYYTSLYEIYQNDYYLNEYINAFGVVNPDWLHPFAVNSAFSNDSNMGSWVFFLNWYINYLINISLIIFIPEVIMVFFKMCTNLVYKFVERSDD